MNKIAKTNMTALVVIPPEEVWQAIQAIRRVHDKQFRRWMPHITLLYPFVPRDRFDDVAAALGEAARTLAPFQATLAEFGSFAHGCEDHTIWLAPEPTEQFRCLHAAFLPVVPECDETATFPGGFVPHLSVGQVRGKQVTEELISDLACQWQPASFIAGEVGMVWRDESPDDVFRVACVVPLGTGLQPS